MPYAKTESFKTVYDLRCDCLISRFTCYSEFLIFRRPWDEFLPSWLIAHKLIFKFDSDGVKYGLFKLFLFSSQRLPETERHQFNWRRGVEDGHRKGGRTNEDDFGYCSTLPGLLFSSLRLSSFYSVLVAVYD